MKNLRLKITNLILFLLLAKINIAQDVYREIMEADSSVYYNEFFIHGWLLFHKQYHRIDGNVTIDSFQFFNIPDTFELDGRQLTKTIISPDKTIDRAQDLIYDENDNLLVKADLISYFKSDSLIRFNYYIFDTLNLYADYYYSNEKLLKRQVYLNLNKDTLEDFQYFIMGTKPYKLRWNHYVNKVGLRQYEEEYYYKGDYMDFMIRNVFNDDQSILFSYKDVRYRDANNRLFLEKYHTFDSIELDYVYDGYRIVYGAPLPTDTKSDRSIKNNTLFSNGKIIIWDLNTRIQNKLVILNRDGRELYRTTLKEDQKSLFWPSFLLPGYYFVQIFGKDLNIAKPLLKVP